MFNLQECCLNVMNLLKTLNFVLYEEWALLARALLSNFLSNILLNVSWMFTATANTLLQKRYIKINIKCQIYVGQAYHSINDMLINYLYAFITSRNEDLCVYQLTDHPYFRAYQHGMPTSKSLLNTLHGSNPKRFTFGSTSKSSSLLSAYQGITVSIPLKCKPSLLQRKIISSVADSNLPFCLLLIH